MEIGLAVDIGSGKQPANIRSFAHEPDALEDPECSGTFTNRVQIRCFEGPLHSANLPPNPVRQIAQLTERVDQSGMALPCLDTTGLDDDDRVFSGRKLRADATSLPRPTAPADPFPPEDEPPRSELLGTDTARSAP